MPNSLRAKLDLDTEQKERLAKTTKRVLEELEKEVAKIRKSKMAHPLFVFTDFVADDLCVVD